MEIYQLFLVNTWISLMFGQIQIWLIFDRIQIWSIFGSNRIKSTRS